MSVIKPLSDDIGIAMVYVTPAGIIVSLGRGFSNLFGHNIAEFIGKPLRGICKDPEMFNKLLSAAVASEAESIDDSGTLSIMHKYGDEIPVHIKYRKVVCREVLTCSVPAAICDHHCEQACCCSKHCACVAEYYR